MNIDAHDEVRLELEAALAVEPLPGFATRVRSRIAREERHQPVARKWRLALLCAAGPALVLVSLYAGRIGFWSDNQTPIEPVRTGGQTRTADRSARRTDSVAQTTRTTDRAVVIDGGRTKPRSALHQSRPITSRSARQNESAHMSARRVDSPNHALVPDDQRVALLHLLGALRAGRATVPATVVPAFDADGALVAPSPVVVAPLTIDPLPLPDPQGEPEGNRR